MLSLILIFIVLSLTGCAKLVSTDYETVQVKITDVYYKPHHTTMVYNAALKMPMVQAHLAIYRVTAEYNGAYYNISGSDNYNKCKDKVNQTTTGTLMICTYDDGTVEYCITSLE